MTFLGISLANIVFWAFLGVFAGYHIQTHDNGKQVSGGLIVTCIFGALGAMSGGYLASFFMGRTMIGFSLEGMLTAMIGMMLLIMFFRASFRKESHKKKPHSHEAERFTLYI